MSTENVETKGLGVLEIKDAEKGEVEAIIATLGVVDRDKDVITEKAIKDGAKVKVSAYGHDAMFGNTPVGRGSISIDGNKAIFKGKLFLSTQRGRETFDVLKELGSEQEWSFGFRILGSEVPDEEWRGKGADRILTKLDAFEVSPVLIGAGVGTRTVAVKEADEEAKKAAEEEEVRKQAAAALKEAEDAIRRSEELRAKASEAVAEYERVQRTLRRLKVV